MTWNKVLLYCLDSFKKHQARVFLFMKNAAVLLPSLSGRSKRCTWGHLAAKRSLSLSMGIYSSCFLSLFVFCLVLHGLFFQPAISSPLSCWALSSRGPRGTACTGTACWTSIPARVHKPRSCWMLTRAFFVTVMLQKGWLPRAKLLAASRSLVKSLLNWKNFICFKCNLINYVFFFFFPLFCSKLCA